MSLIWPFCKMMKTILPKLLTKEGQKGHEAATVFAFVRVELMTKITLWACLFKTFRKMLLNPSRPIYE